MCRRVGHLFFSNRMHRISTPFIYELTYTNTNFRYKKKDLLYIASLSSYNTILKWSCSISTAMEPLSGGNQEPCIWYWSSIKFTLNLAPIGFGVYGSSIGSVNSIIVSLGYLASYKAFLFIGWLNIHRLQSFTQILSIQLNPPFYYFIYFVPLCIKYTASC